jgi:phytoene dehydrogenase-like protein
VRCGLKQAIEIAEPCKACPIQVLLLEEKAQIGGACRTEFPFKRRAPGLAQSTGAYLLGVMPPELVQKLGLRLDTLRRDPHYFLPTTGKEYLLLGGDEARTRSQLLAFFSPADWSANCAMNAEIAAFREDLAACWLKVGISPIECDRAQNGHHCCQRLWPLPH